MVKNSDLALLDLTKSLLPAGYAVRNYKIGRSFWTAGQARLTIKWKKTCSDPHFHLDCLLGGTSWVSGQGYEHKENTVSCCTEEAEGQLINGLRCEGQAAAEAWPRDLCGGWPCVLGQGEVVFCKRQDYMGPQEWAAAVELKGWWGHKGWEM